ncbi:MAG: hypothetical protein CVT98_08150 [Bacteroidetes bacterium HGW-Bacteroidetes-15]|nr:MAG: hypothetical protein CVT98_08150 [Bacteroidetes bacterium HGW-Bacteroidetes-15]
MEKQLLNDQQIFPTEDVIENVLQDSYHAFSELIQTIKGEEFGLNTEWNYYKDGKSWLCKVTYKKKTIFWLSCWDGYFKVGFYFTEKNCMGIADLEIDEKIKTDFSCSKHIGKLIPLVINVFSKDQVKDVLRIIEYKKGLK